MTKNTPTRKDEALQHIDAALGIKGIQPALRSALEAAKAIASPQTAAGRAPFEYENLAVGATLTCKANPNLIMRNGKRTGKLWLFRYRDASNREKEIRIGTYPDMGIADARKVAADMRARKAAGKPLEDAAAFSVTDLCEQFIAEYALGTKPNGEPVKRSGVQDERLLRKYIIPNYGHMPAVEFDATVLRPIISNLALKAPREAEKVRSVVSTMFNVASGRTRKIAYPNGTWLSAGHPNPADGATAPEHKAQSFSPNAEQLKTFVAGLEGAKYGPALMLQLLTMTRVAEATHAAWSEFDLDNSQWHLPAERSKNGHGYTIQLPNQAVALLQDIKANQAIDTAFLFPAPRAATDLPVRTNNVMVDAARIRDAAELPKGFTTHAMRHAGLTWLKENLCPLDVRNAVTNHRTRNADEKVDGGYTSTAKFDALVKEWLQKWADHIDGLQGQNIVQMPITG